jgi:hypothetical protein
MKSHTQEEIVLKELGMVKKVAEIEKKEGLKHCQKIITKVDAEINFKKTLKISNFSPTKNDSIE